MPTSMVHRFAGFVAMLVAGAMLVLPGAAFAQGGFDADRFADELGAAESDYVSENWSRARDKYSALRTSLDQALSNGTIPAEMEDAARKALEVIVYQLGRSHQNLGECAEARDVFADLRSAAGLSLTVKAKLPARLAEASICEAAQKLDTGDLDGAQSALRTATQSLTAADGAAIGDTLSAEQVAELEGALATARSEADVLADRHRRARSEAALNAASGGQCAEAQDHLAALDSPDPATTAAVEACVDPGAEPVVDSSGEIQPWLAIGLMGIGGALIITAVALEGVNASDGDDYEAARDACVSGASAGECQTALDLADDIETQQILTGTLIGVGAAAIGGGLAWYLLTMDSGDSETDEASVSLTPAVGPSVLGGQVSVRW